MGEISDAPPLPAERPKLIGGAGQRHHSHITKIVPRVHIKAKAARSSTPGADRVATPAAAPPSVSADSPQLNDAPPPLPVDSVPATVAVDESASEAEAPVAEPVAADEATTVADEESNSAAEAGDEGVEGDDATGVAAADGDDDATTLMAEDETIAPDDGSDDETWAELDPEDAAAMAVLSSQLEATEVTSNARTNWRKKALRKMQFVVLFLKLAESKSKRPLTVAEKVRDAVDAWQECAEE